MTEAEWLACTDLERMLAFLVGKVSERKLRLFGCLCCRRIWPFLQSEFSRDAVETTEKYVEGLATPTELAATWRNAVAASGALAQGTSFRDRSAARAAGWLAAGNICYAASNAANATAYNPNEQDNQSWRTARNFELSSQVGQLVDIVGNPFRAPIRAKQWRTSNVEAIAAAIYTDRAFERLPILADALEDAGCTDADILNHCRQPGEHVLGCWVVDLLLGKS